MDNATPVQAGEFTLHHLSYSSVSSYSDCGEKFRLRKVVNVPHTPSWAAMGGKAFHSATETVDFLDFGITTDGPKTFDEALDREIAEARKSGVSEDSWHRSGRSSKAWPDKENEAWWREHGPPMVDGWRSWLNRSGYSIYLNDGHPAIEVRYQVEIGDFPALGYIDRVMQAPNGTIGVLDLKSGRAPVSSDQLRDYGLALSRVPEWVGPRPTWGTYYMSRENGCTPPVPLGPRDDAYRDEIYGEALRGIKAGIFLPNRSRFCDSCDVRAHCRAMGGSL